ncbi:hypothetical protein Cob_v001173 [Colletotrichum orbiculare MAFF 240422]|uniref:BTB domain-containing protein n=1 Tax=Colletotrichum orbiculare (strain 104-T / ATCC 96160 / CBS 514.97 / LARS 414 / MAFF 240422) TaxID=1213857 RepID=A0A484G7Y7_COLOR|nr:hypothetical protein Cob_v001173 [Colletotrichum orbiculare MAFF 240422]
MPSKKPASKNTEGSAYPESKKGRRDRFIALFVPVAGESGDASKADQSVPAHSNSNINVGAPSENHMKDMAQTSEPGSDGDDAVTGNNQAPEPFASEKGIFGKENENIAFSPPPGAEEEAIDAADGSDGISSLLSSGGAKRTSIHCHKRHGSALKIIDEATANAVILPPSVYVPSFGAPQNCQMSDKSDLVASDQGQKPKEEGILLAPKVYAASSLADGAKEDLVNFTSGGIACHDSGAPPVPPHGVHKALEDSTAQMLPPTVYCLSEKAHGNGFLASTADGTGSESDGVSKQSTSNVLTAFQIDAVAKANETFGPPTSQISQTIPPSILKTPGNEKDSSDKKVHFATDAYDAKEEDGVTAQGNAIKNKAHQDGVQKPIEELVKENIDKGKGRMITIPRDTEGKDDADHEHDSDNLDEAVQLDDTAIGQAGSMLSPDIWNKDSEPKIYIKDGKSTLFDPQNEPDHYINPLWSRQYPEILSDETIDDDGLSVVSNDGSQSSSGSNSGGSRLDRISETTEGSFSQSSIAVSDGERRIPPVPSGFQMPPIFRNRVDLEVGGRLFVTSIEVLERSPWFRYLLSINYQEWYRDGVLHIDNDPDLFAHILRYLRTGVYPLFWNARSGFDYGLYSLMYQQAKYYLLPKLEAWIRQQKYQDVIKFEILHTKNEILRDQEWVMKSRMSSSIESSKVDSVILSRASQTKRATASTEPDNGSGNQNDGGSIESEASVKDTFTVFTSMEKIKAKPDLLRARASHFP